MTQEDQILASLEEIGKGIDELRKFSKQNPQNSDQNFTSLMDKIGSLEAQISTIKATVVQTPTRVDLSPILKEIEFLRNEKRQEVTEVHNYVDFGKNTFWIITVCLIIAVITSALSYHLWDENNSLRTNDIKFRYMKLRNDIKASKFNTVSDAAYETDSYYIKNSTYVDSFVIAREEELKQAVEAAELAKQREAEAKAADEEAKKLKAHSDSLKNK